MSLEFYADLVLLMKGLASIVVAIGIAYLLEAIANRKP